MAAPTLASLLIQQAQATIYNLLLTVAQTVQLPVTSWLAGDPTRSLFYAESSLLETLENVVVGFIQAGFLDYASQPLSDGSTNPWLAILAKQVFNYDVPQASYATATVTLTNAGGAVYEIDPGDLTFSASASGATYTNTSGGTLTGVGSPGATLSVTVTATQPGSSSTASANEIDTLVTSLNGVTCTNPSAAIGTDAEAPATTVQQCRNKLGSLSPNGPAAAYSFVALNPALTGIQTVVKARVYPDSDSGDVQIYVAGANGTLGGSDVAAVQAAILQWATPLCITPTTTSASAVTVNVTYTLWIYQSVNQTSSQIQAAIQTALQNLFLLQPIGGNIIPPASTGGLDPSIVESAIGSVFPKQTIEVQLSAPSSFLSLTNGQVPQLGTVTGTVNIVTGG